MDPHSNPANRGAPVARRRTLVGLLTLALMTGLWAAVSFVPLRVGRARMAAAPGGVTERQLQALNQLRDELNWRYGFKQGVPRVNLGPCGRVARIFREEWNERFGAKVHIAFVMTPEGEACHHVLIRLPNGDFFDGGNGVISRRTLLRQYELFTRIEEMTAFDLPTLDRWSYGLNRSYPDCENYSDEQTREIVRRHLDAGL
jgi:hypothetical protein